MKSVLWAEAMHVPVLLLGSSVLLVVGLIQVGGLGALRAANPETIHLWRPLSTAPETQGFPGFLFEKSETPWLGVLLVFAARSASGTGAPTSTSPSAFSRRRT